MADSTGATPPARSAANQAMTDRPMTSRIIWMKSVIASARKRPAPNGSSTSAFRPPCTNLAGMPITVSAPNQVANVVVTTMIKGRLRPAIAKPRVFLMRVPAQTPSPSVPSKYSTTQATSVVFMQILRFGGDVIVAKLPIIAAEDAGATQGVR
jgi:hypothetical protein